MAKIVIYGGTFNPFHLGHLEVCKYILQSPDYDRLIVIPNYLPPHKELNCNISAEHRLAMVRLALAEESEVIVSEVETSMGKACYTVDTVRAIKSYCKGDELFLLVGGDMLTSFTSWNRWQMLAKLVTLLAVPRHIDEYSKLCEKAEKLAKYGVKVRVLDMPAMQVSSTEIRLLFSSMGEMAPVPKAVYDYIRENSLYTEKTAFLELSKILKPRVTKDRYRHSCNVAHRAGILGEIHGEDVHKLRVAGMLHDICKNTDHNILTEIIEASDIDTDIDFLVSKNLLHSYAGAEFVKNELGINDEDILGAIRYHTSARRHMTKFEKIIYLADLTSIDRDYCDVHYMRGLSETNLDKAMLYSLEYIVKRLRTDGEPVCNATISALLEYRNLFNA